MERTMTAIEMTGTVDAARQLQLDGEIPLTGPTRVRVLILTQDAEEITESEWLSAAASNPAFSTLHDAAEDLYTLNDGEPFRDEV